MQKSYSRIKTGKANEITKNTEETVMTQQEFTKQIGLFEKYLRNEEKSGATVEKYLRDVRAFLSFLSDFPKDESIRKEHTIAYKEYLTGQYAPASVNSMLTAMNLFLKFIGQTGLCVKLLKIQRQIFCGEEKELRKEEYHRLVKAAEGTRLSYIMQTISGTGIRVSELQYITVEAVLAGKATVSCKNKTRVIFIPKEVQRVLREYIKQAGVKSGAVFVTKSGKPINRSNLWRDMKALCRRAKVSEKKVFPHNLRHMFARLFYSVDRDIVKLADILGHSSINTTRIYTIESGRQHIAGIERVPKILTT